MEWSLGSWLHSHNISLKFVHNFFLVILLIDKQRNTQRNKTMKGRRALAFLRLHYWFDNNILRLTVKDKVNLVLMHQRKSVQLVEYYLGYNINTITKNTWPSLLIFDLENVPWPWPWYLTLRFIYFYIDAMKKKLPKKCFMSRDAKNGTSFVISETPPLGISLRNILRPTRSLYDFRFQSYG